MSLINFFVLVLIVALLAAVTAWAIKSFAPSTPTVVINIIWGVAVLIIVVALLQALGVLGYDPQIPRLGGR